MIKSLVFFFLAGMTIIPAILVVSVRNIFHAALFLIVSLLGVAGIYAMLAADFLFAVQLLVYAGGVMVVLLFVVLLSGKPSDWSETPVNEKSFGALLFSIFLVVGLLFPLLAWPMKSEEPSALLTAGRLGDLLMGPMVLPFEVISLVLVAALIGAIYFSRNRA